jgi:hypothetical protein
LQRIGAFCGELLRIAAFAANCGVLLRIGHHKADCPMQLSHQVLCRSQI